MILEEFQKIGRGLRGFRKGELMVLSAHCNVGKSVYMLKDYCFVCGTELIKGVDEDPNGDMKSKCIRCETEEDIDFDEYPNAKVSRSGDVDYGDGK